MEPHEISIAENVQRHARHGLYYAQSLDSEPGVYTGVLIDHFQAILDEVNYLLPKDDEYEKEL